MGNSGLILRMRGIRPGICGSSCSKVSWKGTRGENSYTYECNVYTTGCKGTAFRGPTETIFENPRIEILLCLIRKTKVGMSDALENVVIVLGRPEDARRRIWNVPKIMIGESRDDDIEHLPRGVDI
jgi:hypothetical protein